MRTGWLKLKMRFEASGGFWRLLEARLIEKLWVSQQNEPFTGHWISQVLGKHHWTSQVLGKQVQGDIDR